MINVSLSQNTTLTSSLRSVPWSSRRRRFAANLQALAAREPAAAQLVESAVDALDDYELFTAPNGNFHVRDLQRDAWLAGLGNHKAAAAGWNFDRRNTPLPRPIVFEGLGFGWLFLHVLKSTELTYNNYSCALHVIEGDPLALAMLLHMHDLQEPILHPRTRWFVRDNPQSALCAFKQAMRTHPEWTAPDQSFRTQLRPLASLPMQQVLQDILLQRARERDAAVAAAAEAYAGKDADYWAARFEQAARGGGPSLRVLGITSRFTTVLQHSMVELQSAVMACGCDMKVAIEPDDHSVENPFPRLIADYQPDLIIQISRMRYENPWVPANVPFLCWDQDNLPCMRTPQAKASLDDLTYVAGHGAVYGWGHLDWPLKNCIFCHPAGATHRYHSGPIDAAMAERFRCDVSYISNASGSPQELERSLGARWIPQPILKQLFDLAAAKIKTMCDHGAVFELSQMQQFIRKLARSGGGQPTEAQVNELAVDLQTLSDRSFRHATLAWVSRWCDAHGKIFRIYGAGWEKHPTLAKHAAGPARPGEEVRAIYRQSRINLQIIENGFIHSRSLDGLATGGFFLTRHTKSDGDDAETLREIHLLGKWAVENKITQPGQIESAGDAQSLARWKKMLAHHAWSREHAMKVLAVWAKTPQAAVVFPMLPQVSFRNEVGFGELAARYLHDDAARDTLACQMRQIVLEQFSYDSHWKDFLGHIARNLAAAAVKQEA